MLLIAEFDFVFMDARVKLAAVDYNENCNRQQAVIQKEFKGSGKNR